jgi:hypothetical protein
MMEEFEIKRGDTGPSLRMALSPESINLAGATVRFQMQSPAGVTVIDEPATIITESPPVVDFAWRDGDTECAGVFDAEFEVTYADQTRETFPNRGFITVLISPDVPRAPPP